MGRTLDFNKREKQYLTIILNDENKTVLMIGTPTKTTLNEFISIIERIDENTVDKETIDDVYNVCAKIMSCNKTGTTITTKDLENIFDLEDIMAFFNAYMEFIESATNSKN